ncbi:MAG: hypothetical protein GY811_28695 [Myxococcales bacterium]|nr:hypothetical protein [Myxococcales bacterium]
MSDSAKEQPESGRRMSVLAATAAMLSLYLASGLACGGAGAGAPCQSHSECDDSYQCLAQVCSPKCTRNSDCGDGFQCNEAGVCNRVFANLGDPCGSEWDCEIGQSCVLEHGDSNDDQKLESSCQEQGEGGRVGSTCIADDDCRDSLCSLGHCSQLCRITDDCPDGNRCESIPRVLGVDDSAFFAGCIEDTSVLSTTIAMSESSGTLRIPVPSSAESFAIVAEVSDKIHLVGVTRVDSPSDFLLFRESDSFEGFLANPIRYARSKEVSTLIFPSNGVQEIEPGVYDVEIEASLPPFGPGTAVPKVSVHYKLRDSHILDLTFYFLNLEDHPCKESMGIDNLDKSSAKNSDVFQDEYLGEIHNIFGYANIVFPEEPEYVNLKRERPDLDGITDEQDLRDLFRLADNEDGLAIFFVRSLPSDGVQTLGTTIPGPPRTPGGPSSGIVVALDSLCYRSWTTLARITAHSMAGQMGLWNNRDPHGITDPIGDSDSSTGNLMYFGEFGGTELSEGQRRVLSLYPGLR